MEDMSSPVSRRTNGRKLQIRDHMDTILETRGFYRKHVANEPDSLVRALSDAVFGTQARKCIFTRFLETFADDSEHIGPYRDACILADRFNLHLEIISSAEKSLQPFCYRPINVVDGEVFFAGKKVLLCFSPPNQFDPIYKRETIRNAAFIQSILYEMLYASVFGVDDAVEAAEVMLKAPEDPYRGKPDFYDKDFTGTALEALENFLIPFPYKVAKAMDVNTYRNIEYDVWTCEKRQNVAGDKKSGRKLSISTLSPGTPCAIKLYDGGMVFGYIQGPTKNNRKIEVFVPLYDHCVYVDRATVLPVEALPEEWAMLPDKPTSDMQEEEPKLTLEEIQRNNLSIPPDDPDWMEKFDFSVPPPLVDINGNFPVAGDGNCPVSGSNCDSDEDCPDDPCEALLDMAGLNISGCCRCCPENCPEGPGQSPVAELHPAPVASPAYYLLSPLPTPVTPAHLFQYSLPQQQPGLTFTSALPTPTTPARRMQYSLQQPVFQFPSPLPTPVILPAGQPVFVFPDVIGEEQGEE